MALLNQRRRYGALGLPYSLLALGCFRLQSPPLSHRMDYIDLVA